VPTIRSGSLHPARAIDRGAPGGARAILTAGTIAKSRVEGRCFVAGRNHNNNSRKTRKQFVPVRQLCAACVRGVDDVSGWPCFRPPELLSYPMTVSSAIQLAGRANHPDA
jgi:hypothetical protein